MAGHTPPPWHASGDAPRADNGDIGVRNDKGRLVAVVLAHPEAPANTALIKAAPDLLTELMEALDLFAHEFCHSSDGSLITDHVSGEPPQIGEQWVKRARAAVALARGEG